MTLSVQTLTIRTWHLGIGQPTDGFPHIILKYVGGNLKLGSDATNGMARHMEARTTQHHLTHVYRQNTQRIFAFFLLYFHISNVYSVCMI